MRMEAQELRDHWYTRALARAGIQRASWHPSRGVDENRRAAEAVYGYYGQLFLNHSYLEWAGMASMIGPAFYAGFRDIGYVPDAARKGVAAVIGRGSRRLARRVAGDLGFYETTFLIMQKKIFEDQAPMHEAYLTGGVPQIEEFYRARIIDAATRDAWRQIDAGRRGDDKALIDRGNRTLLFREQFDIIDWFYVRMFRHHGPVGLLFTYGLTFAGMPSIPGARSYPERYPFVARLPGTRADVQTPLPDGNIAMFQDRWKLIDHDTLPRYLAYVRESPEQARKLVATPVSVRMARYRLCAQAGRLAAAALTGWDLGAGATHAHPRAFAGQHAMIDLTNPPTRESAGYARNADSRVWINRHRRLFDVEVTLPGGRVYHARAETAVMVSSIPTGNPDRLIVQLPPAGIDAAERLLAALAAEWGFPAAATAAWRTDAKRRESGERDYSTHVFTADDAGPVHLEFQISHHVRDRESLVTTLFSWDTQAA